MPALTCFAAESSLLLLHKSSITGRVARNLFFLFRRQNHNHLTAFHLWKLLNLTKRLQLSLQALQHAETDVLMRHFTTAKTQRDFRIVTIFQKFGEITQLDIVIAIIGTGPEFNFLDQDDFLL